ncbi:hypothetical protein FGB62_17g213 [Gracilaria domingensis]|nr:hypothetical protein FGB62_17g213 [Gracilaria domingensis]
MADQSKTTGPAPSLGPAQISAVHQIFTSLQSASTSHWDFSNETIKDLTKRNSKQWHASLTDILATHGYSNLLSDEFEADSDTNKKAFASFRALVTNSISDEVNFVIPDSLFTQSPSKIVKYLETLLDLSAKRDIDQLFSEQQKLRYSQETGLNQYIEAHRRYQALSIEAGATELSTEVNTVRTLLRGLCEDQNTFSGIAATLLATATPPNIGEAKKALEIYESATAAPSFRSNTLGQMDAQGPPPAGAIRGESSTEVLSKLLSNMSDMFSSLKRIEGKLSSTERYRRHNRSGTPAQARKPSKGSAKQATPSEDTVADLQAQLLQAVQTLKESQDPNPNTSDVRI